VQRIAQVVGGAGGVGVRPDQVEQFVAVQRRLRGKREQLDERLRLAQAPAIVVDNTLADRHLKLPKQGDPQRRAIRLTCCRLRNVRHNRLPPMAGSTMSSTLDVIS
jgi:hypothetical protein